MQPDNVSIPEEALSERFLAASGPGGQNVNKVATAVQLRVDPDKLGLADAVIARLKRQAGSKLTSSGELLIAASRFRTQDANRQDARQRLAKMIAKAHVAPRKRRATKPSRAAKARRVDAKKQRGQVKRARGKVEF